MKPSIAAVILTFGCLATPALAEPMTTTSDPNTMPANKPLSWVVAPLDNAPRDLMLFGVARVPANEGTLDRTLRVIAGLGLIAGAATQTNWPLAGTAAAYAGGGILTLTGVTGYCALYHPFGINTRF
jgi:hypothetical protein